MKTPRYDSDIILGQLKIAKSERFMSREQERGLFDSGLSFHSVVLFHSQAIYICRSFYKTSSVMMRSRAALDAICCCVIYSQGVFLEGPGKYTAFLSASSHFWFYDAFLLTGIENTL